MGDAAGLWEAVHAFSNLSIDVAAVDLIMEVVFVHKFG